MDSVGLVSGSRERSGLDHSDWRAGPRGTMDTKLEGESRKRNPTNVNDECRGGTPEIANGSLSKALQSSADTPSSERGPECELVTYST